MALKINRETTAQDKFLKTVYGNAFLRSLIKPFTCPAFSAFSGKLLSCPLSGLLIKPFISANKIDMSDYEAKDYTSFNDFFTRKVKAGARPIDKSAKIISPCDGKATAYKISTTGVFKIKGSFYDLYSLTRSEKIANRFNGGTAVIIRLCVDNYHRYCYPISGIKSKNKKIGGFLHTVNPAALDHIKVFCENSRECCVIRNKDVCVAQIEVGALMVGKISNNTPDRASVRKGEEKGYFEFGGSTIVLLINGCNVREELINNTRHGFETIIKQGEAISF
ncbi:MAG: phosphatidylserine decarboxylase [Ruminococcus sp.]|nr:phosphatidylserine decarboxylase [Ruminococcus sp.]